MRRSDRFALEHPVEHGISLQSRPFRIPERRETIWAANQAGQDSGFRKVQLRGVFPEVGEGRGLNSVTTGAEVDPVNVQFQNLLLGEVVLDTQRHHRFQKFPAESPTPERQAIASELLGDATRTLFSRSAQYVLDQSAADPAPVNTPMFEKARIFTCKDRFDKIRSDFIERHLHPIGAGQTAVDFPIDVEDRVSLRHVTDCFQVKSLCPEGVKHEHAEQSDKRQRDQRQLPAKTKLASAFTWRSASKKLHC